MTEYEEFMSRSAEDVYLAIMDKLGVKVIPDNYYDETSRAWASNAKG